ncbi:MAG: hypothetical protein PVF58_15640 [Candidatus Methanofastidiosia archaeon]|jgi:hypothetical protein
MENVFGRLLVACFYLLKKMRAMVEEAKNAGNIVGKDIMNLIRTKKSAGS